MPSSEERSSRHYSKDVLPQYLRLIYNQVSASGENVMEAILMHLQFQMENLTHTFKPPN